MTVREVIENELKCVQRDCCRLENECAKCDLVLPKEEIINAYNEALKLEKENAELKEINADLKQSLDWANEREREDVKRITELEKEISNLLSCKNCPENKGGYICQKEYEDKCLAQKIQYIKELQEENADIKEKRDCYKNMADTANKVYNENLDYSWYLEGQLTQSKDLLKKLCDETRGYINDQGFDIKILAEAEQFLKEK